MNHFGKKRTAGRYLYTDLALEAAELLIEEETEEQFEHRGVKMSREKFGVVGKTVVEIMNETGSKNMGKPVGKYITIESEAMKVFDTDTHEQIARLLAEAIISLKNPVDSSSVLVIGLGNWQVSPDALGPKVVKKVLVTRGMKETLPEQIRDAVSEVSAVSPGVMGLTGIETGEIVRGISQNTKPGLIIAVDALAARSAQRINTTIQVSDTGVSPGAGMGNKRMRIDEQTLGIPVIAIGVPTVVDAATLVNDTLDLMLDSMIKETEEGCEFYEMLANLEADDKYALIKNVLDPYTGNMFVTPKDVDSVIEYLSNIIANALNIALHPGIGTGDMNRYIY